MKPLFEQASDNVDPAPGSAANSVPLCVDMDGTLIRSDMLVEGVFAAAKTASLYRAVFRLRDRNRARFKQSVARLSTVDVEFLPYDHRVVAFLEAQKRLGRRLVLVTAADQSVANAVADHLMLFEEVIASDGQINLKAHTKAEMLRSRYGVGGFDYAGDSRADLAVWQVARKALLVNAAPRTKAAARKIAEIVEEFPDTRRPVSGLLRAMRPHQWIKNVLVFVPIIVSMNALSLEAWLKGVAAFVAFSLAASGIYMINDLFDLVTDGRHPSKRHRPFASGAVAMQVGLVASIASIVIALLIAGSVGLIPILLVYIVTSISYSMKLKEFPLVDVFMLAALYSVRLLGGGEAVGHRVSLWLLAFSSFLFLSLALVKRVGELSAIPQGASNPASRRGYEVSDLPILTMFGCSSSVVSVLVLALFIQSDASILRFPSAMFLWGIVPLALFWQCRIWLSTARGYMHDDPIVYAARDWVSWIVVALSLGLLVIASVFAMDP